MYSLCDRSELVQCTNIDEDCQVVSARDQGQTPGGYFGQQFRHFDCILFWKNILQFHFQINKKFTYDIEHGLKHWLAVV